LKKNTLNTKNEDFVKNPYLPDYLNKRKEQKFEIELDESGLELEYIVEQRTHKPADVARGNYFYLNGFLELLKNDQKNGKTTQVSSFKFWSDSKNKGQDLIREQANKQQKEYFDRIKLLKTITDVEYHKPELMNEYK